MPRRPDKEEGADAPAPDNTSDDRATERPDDDEVILIPHKSKKTGRLFIIKRTKELDQYEEGPPEDS